MWRVVGNSGKRESTVPKMVKAFNRTVYVGTFQHAVDEKKRVAVPAEWRAAARGTSEFYVLPSTKKCLSVYTATLMLKILEKADDISMGEEERSDAVRAVAGRAHRAWCDKQGRINLPDQLLQYAGIDKEVALVGMFNKFEIWSPERLQPVNRAAMENFADTVKKLGL